MGLLFVPLTTITNGPIPRHEMGNATSLFNLMRNLGASIGIASVTTVVARHTQMHSSDLAAHVTNYTPAATTMLRAAQNGMMSRGVDAATAARQSQGILFGMVQTHAAMLAYIDAFFLLAVMFISSLPLILIMKRPKPTAGGAAEAMAH